MFKRIVASVTIATIVGIGGVAVAATGSSSNTSNSSSGAQHPGRGHRLLKAAAQTAAETIGIDVATLRTETKAKGTVAAVATSHGVAPQAVVDAIVTKASAKIDEAVANGKLDAAKATKLKAKLPTIADKFVNDTTNFIHHGRQRGDRTSGRRHAGQALQVAATTIGIDAAALKAELVAGKSVADVAATHNVTAQAVVDALIASATTQIDAAVSAGKFDASRAATLKQRLPQMFTRLVNHKGLPAHAGPAPDPTA